MSCLLCGPHDLADEALRTRGTTSAVANAAGADANLIIALIHDVSSPARSDGSRCVDFSDVSRCSDGMTTLVAPQNLNAINHMRRTEGGAFPLPSVARMV